MPHRYELLLNSKFDETRALALQDKLRIDEATQRADAKFSQFDQQAMQRAPARRSLAGLIPVPRLPQLPLPRKGSI